jgi:mannose-6-phosphate isomerase-like protein (cupin superfamily)
MGTISTRTAAAGSALAFLLIASGVTWAQGPEPFRADVEKLAKQNGDFRRVLFTTDHVQIVAMSLPPNEDIGTEVHEVDQCFFIVEGRAETTIAGRPGTAKEHDVICVPAGLRHDVRNPGPKPLKLYTLYSPPQHPAGTVHHTKQDAQKAESAPGK